MLIMKYVMLTVNVKHKLQLLTLNVCQRSNKSTNNNPNNTYLYTVHIEHTSKLLIRRDQQQHSTSNVKANIYIISAVNV